MKRKPLEWYGDEDGKVGFPVCIDCSNKMFGEPGLVHACASVGIEHGKSTGQLLREFIDAYHASGHAA